MSSSTALRTAVRPLRRPRSAAAAQLTPTPSVLSSPKPSLLLRPSQPGALYLLARTASAHSHTAWRIHQSRLFSSFPPPPKQPSDPASSRGLAPPSRDAATSSSSSKSSALGDHPEKTGQKYEAASAEAEAANGSAADPALPSATEFQRHAWSVRLSNFMDNFQSRVLTATQTINDLTGYSAIEKIKAANVRLESDLHVAQARLRAARQNYKGLTSHRAATQREVTALLARKDTWNPTDLERFTSLYRMDHELEAQVAAASAELTEAETDESKLSADLNAGILRRYHEEQIWSDRIRQQSTWGTWGLMGVNVLLFLVLQFVAEPWRRKRLMKGIAEREGGLMEDVKRELVEVRAALEAANAINTAAAAREQATVAAAQKETEISVAPGASTTPGTCGTPNAPRPLGESPARIPWSEILLDPALAKAALQDLYSERRVDLRMRDISIIALESATAAAAIAAGIAFAVLRGGAGTT